MMNDKTNNGNESFLTIDDLSAVALEQSKSGTDPLDRFPALQSVARELSLSMGSELMHAGVSLPVAGRAVGRAYILSALAAMAMHRAVWNALLPRDN